MMQGTINVESEYGKGSTFMVTVRQKAVECEVIGLELSQRMRDFTFMGERKLARLQVLREPMPYGKVLIVDDVETNLFVAEGLMAPYQLKIETALSGFAAIEKVESGGTYDVIFMDHMMPEMDGIETTQKIRALGYTGVIVALTANALVGNDEMFRQNGFDDFLPKPIDVRHLNASLNKYVRDRHPEEAHKYKAEAASNVQGPALNPKLLEVFRKDAEKAVITLRKTAESGDIKLFTTTAHAMKSALANVGEAELSKSAFALEKAGLDGNTDFISRNTEEFAQTLEALIKKLKESQPAANTPPAGSATEEDTAFLKEQLALIKTACENFDDSAAYTALDRLKEKQWRAETLSSLEEIRDALFLHSDFEEALKLAISLFNK
jgi:CheY-like chemotaxis protein/HPt (histidine-containing phosphotransfer) domain-containing protein